MPKAHYEYKSLKKADWKKYKDLRLRAFQESPFSFSESFEDEFENSATFFSKCMGYNCEHFTLGCFYKKELIGIATFKRDQRSKARHKGYIHTMYVDPNYRGKGIARKMLSYLMDRARSATNLEQIHLWVLNPKISHAKKLYLKVGFETHGSLVKNDLKINGKYVDAEYMAIVL